MRERIARRIAGPAIASLTLASSLVDMSRAQDKVGTTLDPQNFGQIERGRYLAIAGDCTSCHGVPGSGVPGSGQPFAGGRSIETPFGIVVGLPCRRPRPLRRLRAYRRGLADRASAQTRLDGFWALEIPSCASHLTAREQSTAARR
jgi:hypothetical protein